MPYIEEAVDCMLFSRIWGAKITVRCSVIAVIAISFVTIPVFW